MSNRTPFVIYEGAWSVLERDFERDIHPDGARRRHGARPVERPCGWKIRTDAEELERAQTGEKGVYKPWPFMQRKLFSDIY